MKRYGLVIFLIIYLGLVLQFLTKISHQTTKVSTIIARLAENNITIEKNSAEIRKLHRAPKIQVDFWKVDKEKYEKGEFLGSAILIGNTLIIHVRDPKLENILRNPYTPIGELTAEGVARDWKISYKPGSTQHLKAIASESWRWGYYAEVKQLKK
ncbi:MAG: hypothetical protein B6D53_03365 [Candidatus Omnitrophica bacterium 4484_49]|nr:MAG: hypothetical protein B6D53_03365 [Candidatus Omnitrophica bacterium 4484_49]